MKLTRSSDRDEGGRRYRLIPHEGYAVRVYDSAQTALMANEVMADGQVSGLAKRYILCRIMLVDPEGVMAAVSDLDSLLAKALWEVALIDLDGSHAGGERVIDWEQDADRIEASLWQAYGMPFEDIRERVSIEQLAALLCALPYETPLGRALYYRTAEEPALTEYNREQVEEFRRLRSLYALDVSDDGRGGDAMERMDAATGDAFAAIAGAARRAG